MAKKQPQSIPVPAAVEQTAVAAQVVNPVDLPTPNIPEAPMPVPVVTVSAPASAPSVPVSVAPHVPVAGEESVKIDAPPAPEEYIIVEAIREGFVKNERMMPGTQFPWPKSRKVASWMKVITK